MIDEMRSESVLGETVENAHDARESRDDLVSRAMKRARQAVVKNRIQHLRLKRMGQSLRDRETELVKCEQRWAHETKAVAGENQQKALECLANRIRCRVRLINIRERLRVHETLESELRSRWEKAEVSLEQLVENHADSQKKQGR